MWRRSEAARRYVESLGLLSLLILVLLAFRTEVTGSTRYWFIPGNLLLAWVGLALGYFLVDHLQSRRWLDWRNIVLSAAWLFFLPNTWYVMTDFLHVYPTGEISELFDFVMVGTLTLTGFVLGFTSLYLVHRELARRLDASWSWAVVEAVILLSSFAIYLGRVLRWNSWDVVVNPGGLIINVSDRVRDPLSNPHFLNITGLFFVVLSFSYLAFYRGMMIFPAGKTGR